MRVNVYAEEMTDQIEIIEKKIDGQRFTGLRFYLHLPVSYRMRGDTPTPLSPDDNGAEKRMINPVQHLQGPFLHKPNDDDSSAVTFWGKRDLRVQLVKALEMLDEHYKKYPRT